MTPQKTIAGVVSDGLCHGCGCCAGSCPVGAIRMAADEMRGIFRPVILEDRCVDCGRCREICPGREVDFGALNQAFFGGKPPDPRVGHHRRILVAHASDAEVRRTGASGGLVTALLACAMENGRLDGAVVSRMNPEKPFEAESFLAATTEELRSAAGSIYAPTAPGTLLRDVAGRSGRFAFVGLPCQIHGLRKLQLQDERLRRQVPLVFGLMCSNTTTGAGTEYFLRRWGIRREEVQSLRFREEGWLSNYNMRVRLKDGRTVRIPRAGSPEGTPRSSRLHNAVYHFDFVMPRCLFCLDHVAELADISFGDPRLPALARTDSPGESLLIVRGEEGERLLDLAVAQGRIEQSPSLDVTTFRRAQSMSFKLAAPGRIRAWRRLGRAVPSYPEAGCDGDAPVSRLALAAYGASFFSGDPCWRWLVRPYAAVRFGLKWVTWASSRAWARVHRKGRRTC